VAIPKQLVRLVKRRGCKYGIKTDIPYTIQPVIHLSYKPVRDLPNLPSITEEPFNNLSFEYWHAPVADIPGKAVIGLDTTEREPADASVNACSRSVQLSNGACIMLMVYSR